MKRFLLKSVERSHLIVMVLLSLCTFTNAMAADKTPATSDEINAAIVQEGSVPLTWTNDADRPWYIGESSGNYNYVRTPEYTDDDDNKYSTSLEFSYSSEYDTYISFLVYSSTSLCLTNIYIDQELVETIQTNGDLDFSFPVEPGNHTVEFTFSKEEYQYAYAYIHDVSVKEMPWYEVTGNNPGELVPNLVDVIGDINVMDVALLKVSGSLNDKDWEGIKQLKGLVKVDLTGTDITEVPNSAFQSFSKLYTVFLPETVKTIGSNAFANSTLREFIMPNSVVLIGGSVFYECQELRHVELSKSLTVIPSSTFALWTWSSKSRLKYIEIPEGVTEIGSSAFRYAALESIELPESLTSIGTEAFSSMKLSTIVIPKNVTYIESHAFSNNNNLKEVTLNSYTDDLYSTFVGCDSIQKITVPCVTPPTVHGGGSYDPFPSVDKNTVSVLVPEFALATYKADSYWFQFRNLKSSAEISTSDFWAIHGHLKLNSSSTLSGTPSIEIEAGGIFDVAADTPLALNEVTYSNQENVPAVFLNESNLVTANGLTTKFTVPSANKWYFFSPVTDVNMADVTYPATDSWVIRYYDGSRRATQNSATGNWVNIPADGTLKRGQGYIFQAATAGTLIMPAAASQHSAFFGIGEASMTLDDNSCETAENAGWNLVGNPYPTYYDIYSMALEAPITVWDGSTYRAYSLSDDDFVLRPMQPFFVQKSAADLTLGMPRSGRLGTNAITRKSAPSSKIDANRHRLNLEIVRGENETADDYTRIVINESASLAYEGTLDA
ncbi:MAG: leucine-rich repeat domain-containing protein, partial [Muribaculaceae bacterium]|nr:leucine-rich repeat domain-containing protein [Muribaculaceae bacterium]